MFISSFYYSIFFIGHHLCRLWFGLCIAYLWLYEYLFFYCPSISPPVHPFVCLVSITLYAPLLLPLKQLLAQFNDVTLLHDFTLHRLLLHDLLKSFLLLTPALFYHLFSFWNSSVMFSTKIFFCCSPHKKAVTFELIVVCSSLILLNFYRVNRVAFLRLCCPETSYVTSMYCF